MARFPWRWWLNIEGKGDRAPDPDALARGLRELAKGSEPVPPELLNALADMLDQPKGYAGVTLRMVRPRGGRQATHDTQLIAYDAYTELYDGRGEPRTGVKRDAVIYAVASKHGCDESTVRRALSGWEAEEDGTQSTH